MFKKVLGSIQGWIQKAEQEHQEHVNELLHPPTSEKTKDDKLRRTEAGNVIEIDSISQLGEESDQPKVALPPPPPKAAPSKTAKKIPTPPPAFPLPPGAAQPEAAAPPAPRPDVVVGLAKRSEFRDRDPNEMSGAIVQNETNDTAYNMRNELVELVNEKYARFGESIAAAILTRVFMPNGLELLISKLGLTTTGSATRDHDQLLAYIESAGIEVFCSKAGIKYDPDKVRDERRKYSNKIKMEMTDKSAANRMSSAATPRIQLEKVNIKPVSLPSENEASIESSSGISTPRRLARMKEEAEKARNAGVSANGMAPMPLGRKPEPVEEAPTPVPVPPKTEAQDPNSAAAKYLELECISTDRFDSPDSENDAAPKPPAAAEFLQMACQTDTFNVADVLGKDEEKKKPSR